MFSPANTAASQALKTLYVPAGCVLLKTHRKYITGELFTETYCFSLLYEYLVSLSFISLLVFSSITASTNFSSFSANGNHTVTAWTLTTDDHNGA